MKLTEVQITNYKSIRDSGKFTISDITCLVGKNEAGKTALLEALYKLNPIIPGDGNYNVDYEYPRSDVEDYRQRLEKGNIDPAVVIKATFQFDDGELKQIQGEFGNKVIVSPFITLSKDYQNKVDYYVQLNEKEAVKYLVKEAELLQDIRKEVNKVELLGELRTILDQYKGEEETNEFYKYISTLTDKGLRTYIFDKYLKNNIPKFLYYDEFYQMDGVVNLPQLKQRITSSALNDSDRPLLGLMKLARLDVDNLLNPTDTQVLLSKLEGASNFLTQQIMKYWSQNQFLEMRFDLRQGLPNDPVGLQSGLNIWSFVYNTRHKVSILLGTRSRGFVWFFSFLAWSSTQDWKEPIIILLDDPALFLHAKAQEDMLRFMEQELKPEHQVIYTTHSPWMVDSNRFDRARIVEDKTMEKDKMPPVEEQGTKVKVDVLDSSPDSVFPIQAALGYEIYQTLFIGPNSLVVEGVSDLIYLQVMTGLLQIKQLEGLDTRWTITPVGGADKVPTFIALIGAQTKIKVATLLDIKPDDREKIENIYKKKLLKKKNVMTFNNYTGSTVSDIEDMFDVDFYLMLVNEEYKRDLVKSIAQADLNKTLPGINNKIKEYLKTNPLRDDVQFSHYRPARYLMENIQTLKDGISPDTYSRFNILFTDLNRLL